MQNNKYIIIDFDSEFINTLQEDLYNKLEILEKELSRYVLPNLQDHRHHKGDIISKAKHVNLELSRVDKEITELVDAINRPDLESGGSFMTQNILNNYFDALQMIETQTVNSDFRENILQLNFI